MKKIYLFIICLTIYSCTKNNSKVDITAPKLTNNPSWDVVCTNTKPLLSFFKSEGGVGKATYTVELDTNPHFNSPNFIEYKNIDQLNEFLVEKRIETNLVDKTRYYFRAKAIDSKGNESKWSHTRFYVDTTYNKHFMNLTRIGIKTFEYQPEKIPKI